MGIPIGTILGFGSTLINKVFPDPKAKALAQAALFDLKAKGELKELESAMNIIVAEAGGGWLQRSWRPITMLTFLVLIICDCFGLLTFRLSDEAWTLLQIGLGGYVVGRSFEGVAKTVKK